MFNQEASFTDGNLRLPENFTIEETVGGGDCFFDSVAKGLRQLKPDMQFTVESLRVVCRDLAGDNQDIKKKVIDDARQDPLNNPSVQAPHPDVSNNDELWGFYLSSIEYARESRDKISTKDNIECRYGNTLHVPIWGRPEIEGQMICQKYNIKLHVIEYNPRFGLLHQVIDSSGSQPVENINYDEENVVHIINENNSHFKAVIRQEINRNMDLPHSSSNSGEGVSSSNPRISNTEKDNLKNENHLQLIKVREEENETYKKKWEKYVDERDYYEISCQEIEEIIEGITQYFNSIEEKAEIKNGLETLFSYASDSTLPQVYEIFSEIRFIFSEEERHISYKELLCIIQSVTNSVTERRGEELKFWHIIADCSQRNWIGELMLVQIENHLKRVLNKDEKDRWRDYLYEITNINILIIFKNKLDLLDRKIKLDKLHQPLSSKYIENILYLLSSNQRDIDSRIEKLELSEWHYILKQEYWACKLSEVFPKWNREELLENASDLLDLENRKDAALVEDFVNILNKKQLKLLPKELKEFLQNFRNETWKFDKESLAKLSKANEVQGWIRCMNSLTSQEDLSINKLVELVEDNKATTSEGILDKLPEIKRSINNIHKKEYPSSILTNSTDCKKPISSFTEDDIKKWVEEFKEHGRRSVGEKDQYIKETHEEVLAVVDRAIELKRGFKLRDTQKLAVLAMLTNERNTLAQVSTGEGKSLIVVASAVMQVLYGKKVDIVTSSPVLAKRDTEEPPAGNSDIYELFDISVSHNCSENIEARKRAYSAEVVYGDLSNFQRDYLLHTFYDKNVFGDRNFESVIVDEVDSMLLDGANKMLYLTHRLADLDKLEPVYLYIWQKINLARNEEEFSTEKIKEDVLNELYGIIKKEDLKKLDSELNTEQIDEIWKNLIEANVLDSQGKLLKQSIDSDFGFDDYRDRIHYLLSEQVKREKQVYVPNYLKPFVEQNLEAWIKSAKRARFDVHEGHDYQVDRDRTGNSPNRGYQVILTDRDTGVDLKNTKWQEGLHQFVELKHCCKLSTQSLKAVFISNVSFLQEYDKLYGLTGTLGSKVERELLKEVHNVDFITVPTSKPKRFVEERADLCSGMYEWIGKMRSEAKKLTNEKGRSVLIVCNSVNDAETLEKAFEEAEEAEEAFEEAEEAFGKGTPNVHTYKRDYKPFDVVQGSRKLKQGEIIIATNLAGRGTDIKLTDELKSAGGLHVCLAYLPDSLRVEEQAFGRASRSGDPGSGNLIIIDPSKGEHEIMKLKSIRNNEEVVRVSKIQSHYVDKIQKEEECFKMFSEQYKKLNRSLIDDGTPEKVREILLESCLDKWAFWLDRNGKGIETKTKEEVIEQCKEFILSLNNLSLRNWPAWVHDPVQIIKLAKYFAEIEKYDNAISLFNKIINEEPLFSEAAHYYKAFTLVKKIDWAKKKSEGENKEALRELKAELREAEKLFNDRSKFFAAASAIVDKIEEDINKGKRIIQNESYRKQKEDLSKLYNVFSQSVDDILSCPVTPQSLMNFDITKELAEKLHEKLLTEGILKKSKVKKNISEEELKNISLGYGIPVEVLTNFLSKFQGKEIDEKEFQKELKKNIPLPSKEAFWKHLVREEALEKEIKYVVVNKTKLEVTNPTLFEELSKKVERGELQNKVLDFETQGMAFLNPAQDNDNSYTFRKGEFIEDIGEKRYAELKRKGILSFNRAAYIRGDRISSVTLPEYNSITLEDFISKSNIDKDEAKKILEDLVNKGVLRLADDNKYQLVGQNIENMRFPVYEKAVTKSLSSCFIYKLALENLEDQVRNSSYPIHLRIAAKPHRELMWELVRQRIIKPVRVNAKAKGLKEKVGNIYNKITTEQQEKEVREVTVNSIVQALEQLKSPLKALKVPDSSLKSIIEEPITSWANIEELSTVFFNGLDALIKLDEKKWTREMLAETSMALAIGVTQIAIGSAMEVYSSGFAHYVASGVINDGISDIVFVTRALCSGHFSWEDYRQNKIRSISSAALLIGVGTLGAKLGLQIGKTVSVVQNVQRAERRTRIINNIINCTTGGIVLGLRSKAFDMNVEALIAGSRTNIRAEVSSKIMEELRNHGVIQSLQISYNVLGKDEAKRMIDHLTDYQISTRECSKKCVKPHF
ncbi:protein translocase subunit SecA 2 [Trichonephila clavipes]|nr:protein translocase subunit SecA 2 [Trichonephila clavipes]